MTNENQLIIALGYCIFMLIIFFIYFKYPPKKINYFYGYRTRRSMQNNETWSFANKYAAKLLINFSVYSFFIPPFLYFLYPKNNFIRHNYFSNRRPKWFFNFNAHNYFFLIPYNSNL